jgi:hypothetical protein
MARGATLALAAALIVALWVVSAMVAAMYFLEMTEQHAMLYLGFPMGALGLVGLIVRRRKLAAALGYPPRGEEEHLKP